MRGTHHPDDNEAGPATPTGDIPVGKRGLRDESASTGGPLSHYDSKLKEEAVRMVRGSLDRGYGSPAGRFERGRGL